MQLFYLHCNNNAYVRNPDYIDCTKMNASFFAINYHVNKPTNNKGVLATKKN